MAELSSINTEAGWGFGMHCGKLPNRENQKKPVKRPCALTQKQNGRGDLNQRILTQHQSQYYAWLLTRRAAGDSVESLASNLKALPEGQRQLISLVLWKLLASSTHAIAGALETMAKRLQGELDESSDVPDLAEVLDEDYESLDQIEEERADEWNGQDPSTAPPTPNERDAVAQEIAEPRHFKTLATNIRDNSKGKALLTALDRAFSELERLGAAKKALEVLAGATR